MAAKKTTTRRIRGASVEMEVAQPKRDKKPLPAQARGYPTLKAWLENEKNRERLKEILTDPVYIAACSYAEESFRVKSYDLTGKTAMLDLEVMRKTAIHAGVVEHTRLLHTFLKSSDPVNQIPDAWEHILPKHS